MSFEPEFLELMPHQVGIEEPTGRNFDGTRTYSGSPKYYSGRVVGKGVALRTQIAQEFTLIYTIFLDDEGDSITMDARVTLPSQFQIGGTYPQIFTVNRLSDDIGMHHTVLACGWMYHRQGL